jgi:ATP adenylyltransferase
METGDECQICQKHRGEGPLKGVLIGRTDRFWIWHGPRNPEGMTRLGHVIIESDRHAPYLADLDEAEAAALGTLRTRLARALRSALSAEFVFAAVIGTGVAHFHEHLLARPSRAPVDVVWFESDELLELGDDDAATALSTQLESAVRPRTG